MTTQDTKSTAGQRLLDAVGWRMPELLAAAVAVLAGMCLWSPLAWLAVAPLAWIVIDPLARRMRDTRSRGRKQLAASDPETGDDTAADSRSGDGVTVA